MQNLSLTQLVFGRALAKRKLCFYVSIYVCNMERQAATTDMGYNSEQRKHFSFGPLDFPLYNLTLENWFFFSFHFFYCCCCCIFMRSLARSLSFCIPFSFIPSPNALCIIHLISPKKRRKRNCCYYCYRVLASSSSSFSAAAATALAALAALAVLHWYFHLFSYVPNWIHPCDVTKVLSLYTPSARHGDTGTRTNKKKTLEKIHNNNKS